MRPLPYFYVLFSPPPPFFLVFPALQVPPFGLHQTLVFVGYARFVRRSTARMGLLRGEIFPGIGGTRSLRDRNEFRTTRSRAIQGSDALSSPALHYAIPFFRADISSSRLLLSGLSFLLTFLGF